MQNDFFMESLRRHHDDTDAFVRVLVKNPAATLHNLLTLEEEIDANHFVDVVLRINRSAIDQLVTDPHAQAYLHYLILKVQVVTHNKKVSLQNLLANKYDFSADRLVAEFSQNLLFLKNTHKFIVFEDRDDRAVRIVLVKRAMFFEWLATKMFKLFVLFCCNVDFCKDVAVLASMCAKAQAFHDLCERFFVDTDTLVDSEKRDRVRSYVEVYVRDLLSYLKAFAYSKEKQTVIEECRALGFLSMCLGHLLEQHPLIFVRLRKEYDELLGRVGALKLKYGDQRILEMQLQKPLTHIDEVSNDDGRSVITELLGIEQHDRLSTIKEMSSKQEKQSSVYDGEEGDLDKLEIREKPPIRRSSILRRQKPDLNFF